MTASPLYNRKYSSLLVTKKVLNLDNISKSNTQSLRELTTTQAVILFFYVEFG